MTYNGKSTSSPTHGFRSLGLVIACLISLSLPARAQPAKHDTEIDQALSQLSSDDWKIRQRATQTLIQLADDALGRLQHVADTATDDEVRTRAAAAIAQIEENKVTGASLVTLHLKDAPAAQAFAELARQARTTLPPDPPSLWNAKSLPPRVTLDVDHRPFWEVMQTLSARTGLEPAPITRHNRELGLGITRGDAEWMDKPITCAGPLLIRADRITRTSTLQLKPGGDLAREFTVSLTVYAEPKLRVLDYSGTLTLEEAVDENGLSLIPPPDNNGVNANVEVFGNQRDGNASRWDVGATLHYPRGAGKRIAKLRATTALQVQTRSAALELPIAGAKNVTRVLDGLKVTVKNLDANRCELVIHRDGRSDAEWYAVRMQLYAGQAQLLDDKGQVVARNQNSLDTDESGDGQRMDLKIRFAREPGEDGKDPKKRSLSEATKLIWEFPVEIRELTIPFEFRDLDIP